jgi:hypothetical protein
MSASLLVELQVMVNPQPKESPIFMERLYRP